MTIDLVAVSYRAPQELEAFLHSLRQVDVPFTLTVIDNNSPGEDNRAVLERNRGFVAATTKCEKQTIIYNEVNAGYAQAVNQAMKLSNNPIAIILNSDTKFLQGSASAIVSLFEQHPNTAIIGPRTTDSNGRITHAGIFRQPDGTDLHRDFLKTNHNVGRVNEYVPTVSGSNYAVRRDVWDLLTHCVAEDSLVWTVDGPTPIQDIRPLTPVWSYDKDSGPIGSVIPTLVSHAGKTGTKPTVTVQTDLGEITCTDDHKLLTAHGTWIEAGSCVPGTQLMKTWMPAAQGNGQHEDDLEHLRDIGVLMAHQQRIPKHMYSLAVDELTPVLRGFIDESMSEGAWSKGAYTKAADRSFLEGARMLLSTVHTNVAVTGEQLRVNKTSVDTVAQTVRHVRDSGTRNVYDLTVPNTSNFIVNGIVAHNCELMQLAAPDTEGAFLPTRHYFEETYCSEHARAHGWDVMYAGTVNMIHEWHRSSPQGSLGQDIWDESEAMFLRALAMHGINPRAPMPYQGPVESRPDRYNNKREFNHVR